MALMGFADRIQSLTSTTGTGTLTLTTASTQYRLAIAALDGLVVEYILLDVNGTAWETGRGTYTHSSTTLTRTAFPPGASSTGSGISLSASNSTVILGPTSTLQASNYAMSRSFIRGGALAYATSTTISCTAVSAFIESANQVYDFATPSNLTISVGASTIGHVYLKTDGTIVDSATAPNATPFAGNARSKTGDTSQRYLGSYVTDSSSHVLPFTMFSNQGGMSGYQFTGAGIAGAPYRVLNGGTQTSLTAITLTGLLPANVCTELFGMVTGTTTTAQQICNFVLSTDGVTLNAGQVLISSGLTSENSGNTIWCLLSPATPSLFYSTTNAANLVYLDVFAYKFLR